MAELFEQTKQNISLHINNCFKEKELNKTATVKEYLTVQKEGRREVRRTIQLYNLDVIISVGYRVKSKHGTQFRIWANQVIRNHLIKGYSINQKRLNQTEQQIKFLRSGIQIVSRAIEEKAATLLYLIIKNIGITDGNKRIAAACFLMFLEYNGILTDEWGHTIMSNEALASLTLFIASSKADEMETVKNLTVSILNRN